MTKHSENLLNGKKKEKELKAEFNKIKKQLPFNWVRIYVNTYCKHLRAMDAVDEYTKFCNIRRGRSTPQPSEMRNIRKILEMDIKK